MMQNTLVTSWNPIALASVAGSLGLGAQSRQLRRPMRRTAERSFHLSTHVLCKLRGATDVPQIRGQETRKGLTPD